MMPGVGFEEMILLVVVAIVVIGPKDLPLMMRKFGRFTGKMRAMAFEFKQGIDELGRQAELAELRKEVADLKKATGIDEIRRDLQADSASFRQDMNNLMRETPKPEATASGDAAPEPKAIPDYAGLSADHPGYDTGIAAPSPEPSPAPAAPAALPEPDVHVIPDEDARPAAIHPAASAWPVKQDTPA